MEAGIGTRALSPDRLAAVAIPLTVSVAAFGLYLHTAARTISWAHGGGDGPELSAAAAVLGIAHPPGYPLYLLLGHLFAQLPVGEVAFRVGLLSAVAAAVGAGLAAHLAGTLALELLPPAPLAPRTQNPELRTRLVAALSAGAILATSPLYWSQATIPEVYTLHAALVLLALLLLASWRPGKDSLVVALALLFGLGLGNHVTLALLALPAALFLIVQDPGLRRRRTALIAPSAFLVGLAVYLYLPVRAATDPPLNWGDPSEAGRFLAHVTAGAYRGYWGGRPLADLLARIPAMAQLLLSQLTWPGLLLSLVGLVELEAHRPALFRLLAVYLLLTLGFTLLYNAENGQVYILPVVLVLATTTGLGISLLGGNRAGLLLAVAVTVAIPVYQLWTNFGATDLSADRSAAIYAGETLANAAPNELLVTERDEQTFVLWYEQAVKGTRPDVVVVDRRLLAADWYRAQLERRHPGMLARLLP
jgi:hypothetical protein